MGQIRSALREISGMGVKSFCLTDDDNVELEMLKEEVGFMDFYGPFFWRSRKVHLMSYWKNLLWMDNMVEFRCSVASV